MTSTMANPDKIEVLDTTEFEDNVPVCNLTTSSNCSNVAPNFVDLYENTPEAVIVPCVFALVLLVGVIGNALLILSFVRHKTLSTPHNALVVNLASGDFIFLIVSLPFNSTWYTLPYWPFGLVICKLSHFAESLATAVVIISLAILSIERCLIVTGKKLWRQQKRGPLLLTFIIWTISLVVSLPNSVSATTVTKIIENDYYIFCYLYDPNWSVLYLQIHVISKFILFFCLPLIVITVTYIIIAVHLLVKAFPFNSEQTKKSSKSKGKNQNIMCLKSLRSSSKDKDTLNAEPQRKKGAETNALSKRGSSSSTAGKTLHPVKKKDLLKSKGSSDEKLSMGPGHTEITEVSHTPVLPDSFVYTGPVSATAQGVPGSFAYEKNSTEVQAEYEPIDNEEEPVTPITEPLRETAPLNRSNSNAVKQGYKVRQPSLVAKRRKLALTVLVLILAFAVCWTPRHIYLIWFHFLPGRFNLFWHVFKIVGFCLSFSNSAVNPIVFYVLDAKFRSFVHSAFCKVCMQKCKTPKSSTTETMITMGERDSNATVALSEMKSKEVTQL